MRWLSSGCPFCPVYLLLLFAIHSLDVRGSRCSVRRWNLNVYATHKPDIKRTFNGQTQDTCRIYTGHDEWTTELKNGKNVHNGGIQKTYRITTGGGMDDRQEHNPRGI